MHKGSPHTKMGFPKLGVPFPESKNSKACSILRSILGSPRLWNLPCMEDMADRAYMTMSHVKVCSIELNLNLRLK